MSLTTKIKTTTTTTTTTTNFEFETISILKFLKYEIFYI